MNLDLSAPYMNIENGVEVDYSEEFKSVIMVIKVQYFAVLKGGIRT